MFKIGDFAYDKLSESVDFGTLRLVKITGIDGPAYATYRIEAENGFWSLRRAEHLQVLSPEERALVVECPLT